MRNIAFIALIAVAATLLAHPAQAATLVGWYQFNDPGNLGRDSSGNHNDGTIYNDGIPPAYSSSASIEGAGSAFFNGTFNQQNFNFEGGGGRIDVPINTGPVAMPDMSWGAWVKATLVDYGRYVLSSDQYNGGRTIGVDNRAADNVAAIVGNQSPWVYNTGVAAPIGDWIFIGAVYRNDFYSPGVGDLTMYVGNQIFSSITTHINNTSPSYTSIGGDAARERYWNGLIDNVFIFDGALSQSEMNAIINNPTGNLLGGTPVPEIDPAGMGSVLALVTGALGLLERRRLKSKAA
jgi:hypothetical protein